MPTKSYAAGTLHIFTILALLLLANSVGEARDRGTESGGTDPQVRTKSVRFETGPKQTSGVVSIAYYTFDDGLGGPDPMGWTTMDASAQLDTFFHVDDFAGLGGGEWGTYTPISGSKSLWCGARPGGDLCYYATLPGYGSNWDQRFTSTTLNVTGDVTIAFVARFESEAGYDQTALEYFTKSDRWHTIEKYNGTHGCCPVDSSVSETVAADSLDGAVRFRFRFTSDGAWSDEDGLYPTDGAVVLDDLVVSDGSGVVDSQDFEAEAVGAIATADGNWTATPYPPFGDYAALFDGSTILQEDTMTTNNSFVWGFFQGSTDYNTCDAPDSSQMAVPDSKTNPYRTIRNHAISPPLDISNFHVGGFLPDSLELKVAFDLYKDFALQSFPYLTYVRYEVRARSLSAGCWSRWYTASTGGGFGEWVRELVDITTWVTSDATHIQVGLGVFDLGDGVCRSHAPLFDNVEVYAEGVVPTGLQDPALPRYVLHQNTPNPFNPATTVRYEVPDPGAVVSLRVYDVSGRLVGVLKDGFVGPGPQTAVWDGKNVDGRRVSSGVYFYRLSTLGFDQTRKMVLLK
jgi:hypothetical protein